MNTSDEKIENVQSHYFDPFPEPQTIPAGWDTSGLVAEEVHKYTGRQVHTEHTEHETRNTEYGIRLRH